MCEQCTTEAQTWGEVIPGWHLMRARIDGATWKAGEWGLVWSNDPTFTWTGTPTPNPAFGMTDEEEEALWKTNKDNEVGARIVSTELPESFKEAFDSMNPLTGYDLVVASMRRGYDPETSGDLAWWLWDWFGEYLKTATPRHHGDHAAEGALEIAPVAGVIEIAPGSWSFGDLAEVLGDLKQVLDGGRIPVESSGGAFLLRRGGETVGVVGRSIEPDSGRNCIVVSDYDVSEEPSRITAPDTSTTTVEVVEMPERQGIDPRPAHDRLIVRVDGETLLDLW